MRLAWDGLPRDLDLSREDLDQLRTRARAELRNHTRWRPHVPRFIEFVPGGAAFVTMLVWMPALWLLDSWPLKIAVGLACVVLQVVTHPRHHDAPPLARYLPRHGPRRR